MDGLEQGGGGDHVGPQRPPIHPSNRDSPATPLLPQRLCPGPAIFEAPGNMVLSCPEPTCPTVRLSSGSPEC